MNLKPLIILMLLIGCAAPEQPEPILPPDPTPDTISLQEVVMTFDKIDSELNTSWRTEEIPKNLIRPQAIEEWRAHVLFLKNQAALGTIEEQLLDARLNMLKAQAAHYLVMQNGPESVLETRRNVGVSNVTYFVSQDVDCTNAPKILHSLRLLQEEHNAWKSFFTSMDDILQESTEARTLIGVNENRPKFYNYYLTDFEPYKKAITDALVTCAQNSTSPQFGATAS